MPLELGVSTSDAYKHLNLSTRGEPRLDSYIYSVVVIYQTMMYLNRPQILRDRQANAELQVTFEVIQRLGRIDNQRDLEASARMVLLLMKRVIETCELQRGFLQHLFGTQARIK